MMKKTLLTTLFSALFSLGLYAEELENHAAHEHGIAEMTVVAESGQLEMTIDSPAANIVGFEHKAETTEQQKLVEQVRSTLLTPMALFEFEGADCQLLTADVNLTDVENQTLNIEHEHEHEHEHEQESDDHANVVIAYQFSCGKASPSTIRVGLFQQFPLLQRLNVAWLIAQKQGINTLTSDKNKLSF